MCITVSNKLSPLGEVEAGEKMSTDKKQAAALEKYEIVHFSYIL